MDPEQKVICEVSNQLASTLTVERVHAKGPITNVEVGRSRKHESWGRLVAPIFRDVAPGKQDEYPIYLSMDLSRIPSSEASLKPGLPRWAKRLLWRAFGWRSLGDVKVRIILTASRRSSPHRIKRFTHTIRMSAAMLMKIEDSIDASAAKK